MDPNQQGEATKKHRYLRVQAMSGLRDVLFAPKRPVRGVYAGRHASKQRGHCVEFNDYREYTPGDEVGDIDWKVYGRSDRLYIKRFEHQTDMTVSLLVDASASMRYTGFDRSTTPGRAETLFDRLKIMTQKRAAKPDHVGIINPSKYDQACLLAGAIAFMTVRQQDRVGFAVAQGGRRVELEARGGFVHLNHVLDSMERVRPGGKANLPEAIEELDRAAPRRGLTVLFSDLLEDREPILRALGVLTAQGGEVIVFHVVHEDELNLPDLAEAVFVDSESGQRVRVDVRDVNKSYREQFQAGCDAWRRDLSARGIDYNRVSTGMHTHEAIRDYLFARSAVR